MDEKRFSELLKQKCFRILLNEFKHQLNLQNKGWFYTLFLKVGAWVLLLSMLGLVTYTLIKHNEEANSEFEFIYHLVQSMALCLSLGLFLIGKPDALTIKKREPVIDTTSIENKIKQYIDFENLSAGERKLLMKECEQLLK